MSSLPRASTTLAPAAAVAPAGVDLVLLMSPVARLADGVPRLFGTAGAINDAHGFCEGVEYAALHLAESKLPVYFAGLPIAVPGVVGRVDSSGNTGTSTVTVIAGAEGVLAEHDGAIRVDRGGVVGTDQIGISVSLDGGRNWRPVRLGTATSYSAPYHGVIVSFVAGTLVAGDVVLRWHGTAPRSDAPGWHMAREAAAASLTAFRSAILCGDLQDSTEAEALAAEWAQYATVNDRFVGVRASILDRAPNATMGAAVVRMAGAPSLTFDATLDTVARASGSWTADGFAAGDYVTFTGTVSNNFTARIVSLTASTLTLATNAVLSAETVATAVASAVPGLVFALAGQTVTRSRGSWIADGYRVGVSVTVDGTSGGTNDFTAAPTAVTALVLTFPAATVDALESINSASVTIIGGQTPAVWMAAMESEFASVDALPVISLSAGRGTKSNPFHLWAPRRPAAWAASIREYRHDLHVPTWRKDDGPTGWSLDDTSGTLAEWDDRVYGGAGSAARFTTFRSWANGPVGAFLALDMTRATEGSILSMWHNARVVDRAMAVCQAATEMAIGRDLEIDSEGHATPEALASISTAVNELLEDDLLANKKGEGRRCSAILWTPSADDDFSVATPTLTGVLEITLKGTIHSVATSVRVNS